MFIIYVIYFLLHILYCLFSKVEKEGNLILNKILITVLFGTILLFLVGLYALLIQVFDINNTNKATIIGGILGMVGGAIGAVGAYLASVYQIKNDQNKEKVKSLYSELPIYIVLHLEFEKITKQLSYLKDYKNKNHVNDNDDDFFEQLTISFDEVIWDRWIDINKISDSILLKELLIFEDSFKRTIEVFKYDISKSLRMISSENKFEASRLLNEIEVMKSDKKHYWNEIDYCYEKAIKLQEALSNKKASIEKIIKGELSIEEYQYFSDGNYFRIDRSN